MKMTPVNPPEIVDQYEAFLDIPEGRLVYDNEGDLCYRIGNTIVYPATEKNHLFYYFSVSLPGHRHDHLCPFTDIPNSTRFIIQNED